MLYVHTQTVPMHIPYKTPLMILVSCDSGKNCGYAIEAPVHFFVRSSRNRVDLLSYESKATDKREQYDWKAKKNLGGNVCIFRNNDENEICAALFDDRKINLPGRTNNHCRAQANHTAAWSEDYTHNQTNVAAILAKHCLTLLSLKSTRVSTNKKELART